MDNKQCTVKDLIEFLQKQDPNDIIVGDYDGMERDVYIGKQKRWEKEEELPSENYLIISTTDYCFEEGEILWTTSNTNKS